MTPLQQNDLAKWSVQNRDTFIPMSEMRTFENRTRPKTRPNFTHWFCEKCRTLVALIQPLFARLLFYFKKFFKWSSLVVWFSLETIKVLTYLETGRESAPRCPKFELVRISDKIIKIWFSKYMYFKQCTNATLSGG